MKDDTVSRRLAIDEIDDYLDEYSGLDEEGYHSEKWCAMAEAKMVIETLPSAQPESIKINIEDFNKEDWERLKKEWGNTPITVLPAQPTDADIQKMQDIEQAMLEKAYESGKQDAAQWIPCSERLPDNRVSVIVCYREWQQYAKRYIYSIVIGWYARKHSVRENVFSEWEGDCDYDEDEDEFYIQEGWYEFTTQGNADLMNWYINAEVVAWMPLPEPYAERRTDDGE